MFDHQDVIRFERIQQEHPELVQLSLMTSEEDEHVVSDSSTRLGHYVLCAPDVLDLVEFLPAKMVQAAARQDPEFARRLEA
jgi:hypothetical protein